MKQQLTKCDDIEAMSELYAQVREDFKIEVSEAMKGNQNGKGNQNWKGKHHSEETRRKMSISATGKPKV